jgi:multiple sugar transport system substrate-binding protein
MEELTKEGLLLPGILNLDIDAADQQFAAGNVAFDLGGSFTMATLTAMGMKGEDIIAFPVPPISGSKYTEWTSNPFTLTQVSVSAKSDAEHQNAALQYVQYLSSKAGAVLFSNNGYTVSAVDLGADVDKLSPDILNMTKSFVSEETPLSRIPGVEQNYFWTHAEWRTFETSIQKMIGGNATAEQAAKDFDTAMDKEIKAAK